MENNHEGRKIYIETERLILRDWMESDYKPFIALNADAEVMEFFPSVQTADTTLAQIKRLAGHIATNGFGFFAVERKDNNEFIGFTGLAYPRFEAHFTPCIEIGWRLSKADWNQGFATEAAKACLQFGFDSLRTDTIYSFASVHNQRSENVMKKIGMVHDGFFEHPSVEEGNWLRKHVLYKITKQDEHYS